jgi:ATP-binding cassette subfamily B protein
VTGFGGIISPSSRFRILKKIHTILGLALPYRGALAGAFLSLCIAAAATLALGTGIKNLIDYGFGNRDSAMVDYSLLFMGVGVAVLAIASFGRSYYVGWVGERVMTDLRQQVFNHLLLLDVSYFEQIRPGELVSRITADTTLVQTVTSGSLPVAIRNFLLLTGGLAMMMATSPKLTCQTLLVIPFILVPILIYGRRIRTLSRHNQDCLADAGGFLEETLGAIHTCQAFCHEDVDRHQFFDQTERVFKSAINRIQLRSFLACLVIILVFGGISLVLWQGGRDVVAGTLKAGQLSAFIYYAIVVAASAGSFSEIFADLQRAAGAMDRLLEILAMRAGFSIQQSTASRKLPALSTGVVAIHNVCFAYPADPSRPVLNNVTLSASPGEKIAIVGPSGAGKSTIFTLLLRFYTPQSGAIYLDGIDVRNVDVAHVRNRMGLVPQEPVIFSRSLYENILYGQPQASETDVWKAAEMACMQDVISSLPDGIHTRLGTKGIRLSGGQKQRLAIARALLRNPSLLLLDEATSALDSESEYLVQKGLDYLMGTRTTFIIAHRLSTILKADRIIVLDRGRVDAVGTHAELVSQDGLYRRLAMMQHAQNTPDARLKA